MRFKWDELGFQIRLKGTDYRVKVYRWGDYTAEVSLLDQHDNVEIIQRDN